ncbi:flagellar hook-associated protein FlgL [Thiomicrorhabdus chilensis]|uniref:flagellar hook-associated protein FlgL n=1 Tax=Thiomicrorhabdus chilensis TaxID=63656 RepID=UPI00048B40FA|nr:flagellar hook-associated protein FlgL [Thiomicrorhabdus chilensis]
MRISTNMFHNQGLSSIQSHQEGVLDTQNKLSSGKRVNAPSDDPVAAAQIHSLNRTMDTIDQYAKNGEFAKSQLAQEETAIADTIESLQRARELAIQMNNGTYNPENRVATAEEIGQIINQVASMMNYTNSEGEKLFAGNSVNVDEAFVEDVNNPGYYAYIGSPNAGADEDPQANFGSRFLQIGFDADNKLNPDDLGDTSRVRVTDNGDKVFQVLNPTTVFTGGVVGGAPLANQPDANILNVLVEFKKTLENGDPPPDSLVDDMDSSLVQLSQVQAEIGGRQNRIQSQYDAGESFKISLEERRMTLEDMDLVKGITELTKNQNALQMAQQVFTRVQDMSLFNYLR